MTDASLPSGHAPVMPDGRGLPGVRPGETVVDATAGRGGHAPLAAGAGSEGTVVLCDLDPENLDFAGRRVREAGGGTVLEWQGSFARAPRDLGSRARRRRGLRRPGRPEHPDRHPFSGVLVPLRRPADMRMDPTGPVSAAELV